MHADDYAYLREVMRVCGELCAFGGIYESLSGVMRDSKILCVFSVYFLTKS